jgi:hypothetical protein
MRLFFREGPLPPVALSLAVLAAFPLHMVLPYSMEYVFLIAVIVAGWIAGRGPGLVTSSLRTPCTRTFLPSATLLTGMGRLN